MGTAPLPAPTLASPLHPTHAPAVVGAGVSPPLDPVDIAVGATVPRAGEAVVPSSTMIVAWNQRRKQETATQNVH